MTLPEIESLKEVDTSVRESNFVELRRLTRIPCRSELEDKAYHILLKRLFVIAFVWFVYTQMRHEISNVFKLYALFQKLRSVTIQNSQPIRTLHLCP